nr:hypothetical protein [Tanacetum cinerariifolium]
METTRSQKYAYESPSHRSGGHRPHRGSMRPSYRPAGHRPHGPLMNPKRPTMNENLPLVAQKITLLIWEGRVKLAVPRTTLMTKVIRTVAALGTRQATYPIFLILSHLMEDMCLLVKEDARLQAREPLKSHNMYSIDLNNIVPHKDLTFFVAKASADEYTLWHRRL